MSYVYQAGLPHQQRRRRAFAIVGLLVALVFLVVLTIAVLVLRDRADDSGAVTSATPCRTAEAETPAPSNITVNVYNSTQRTGLAANTAADLRTHRFQIGAVGDDPRGTPIDDVAEIRHGQAGKDAATVLATRVRGARLMADERDEASLDLVLGERFSVVAPRPTPSGC